MFRPSPAFPVVVFFFRLTVLPPYFCTQLGLKLWPGATKGVMRSQMADLLLYDPAEHTPLWHSLA